VKCEGEVVPRRYPPTYQGGQLCGCGCVVGTDRPLNSGTLQFTAQQILGIHTLYIYSTLHTLRTSYIRILYGENR
jgi:hypothetical protein